jgi:hypothetical protein
MTQAGDAPGGRVAHREHTAVRPPPPTREESPIPRIARIALAAAVALACAVPATAARASILGSTLNPCGQTLTQPFLPWSDISNYALMPGGAAESARGWTLAGGAAVVTGNEPSHVHAAGDSHSIAIPAGGSARTAPMCIGLLSPTARLFMGSASSTATLAVDLSYTDLLGLPHTVRIGKVSGATGWRPTPAMLLLANVTSLSTVGGTASIRLTFTASGGTVRIDDVYVDPYKWR